MGGFRNLLIDRVAEAVFKRDSRAFLGLVVVLIMGAAHDFVLLLHSPVAVGIDGYYYVLQVTNVLSTGHFYLPTRVPIVLYVLALFARVTHNVILGIKVASVLCQVFLSAGIFAIIKATLRRPWWGVLGATLAETSRLHLYLTGEFIANLAALTLLIWGCYFVIRYLLARQLWPACLGFGLMLLAILSHRSMLPIFVMIVASFLIFHWFVLWAARGKINWYALLLIVLLFTGPGVLAIQHVFTLPETISSQLTPLPGSILLQWFRPEGLLVILATIGGVALIFAHGVKNNNGPALYLIGSTLGTLIVTQNPFLNRGQVLTSIAGRLSILSYIQIALIVPGIFWLTQRFRRGLLKYAFVVLLLLMILSATGAGPYGMGKKVLSRRERLVQGLKSHAVEVPQHIVVVAAHGDEFIVTTILGVASEHQPPGDSDDRLVYWLVDAPFGGTLTAGIHIAEDTGARMVLITDEDLRHYLTSADEREKMRLFQLNLHLARTFRHAFTINSPLVGRNHSGTTLQRCLSSAPANACSS